MFLHAVYFLLQAYDAAHLFSYKKVCDKSIFELLPHLLRIYVEKKCNKATLRLSEQAVLHASVLSKHFQQQHVPQAFILTSIYSSSHLHAFLHAG